MSWWICNLDYPTVKRLLRRQRWQPATRAFTPSLLCPHRHFQLLQIILLIRLLMALLLIPFQRAESWILGEVEQVFSSSGFFSTTLSKTSYNLKKKQFFFSGKMHWISDQWLWNWTEGNNTLFPGYLLFYIATYLSSQRWLALCKQVQNVRSCPKNLTVSLVLIIIAWAHDSSCI